jgi:Retroviral aspartyl protease
MTDGSITACQGTAAVRVKVQGQTFRVTAYVVKMSNYFYLVLGQQWLMAHKAMLHYVRQSLTLRKGSSKAITL